MRFPIRGSRWVSQTEVACFCLVPKHLFPDNNWMWWLGKSARMVASSNIKCRCVRAGGGREGGCFPCLERNKEIYCANKCNTIRTGTALQPFFECEIVTTSVSHYITYVYDMGCTACSRPTWSCVCIRFFKLLVWYHLVSYCITFWCSAVLFYGM